MKVFWLNDALTFHADNPEERHALAILLRGLENLKPEHVSEISNEGGSESVIDRHPEVALSS
jgi:hypothetical protein